MALGGKGRLVSPSTLTSIFGRLDGQSRVEVRETNCGLSVISLRYARPKRMQLVAWLKGAFREPRETQIGNHIGYTGHEFASTWPEMGVTAHRLLLPDAWTDWAHVRTGTAQPSFYLVMPPELPVRDLTVRTLPRGKQQIFVEQWRGVLDRCPAGASCPAPNIDPRFLAQLTAVLRVDARSGLPTSLTVAAQSRGMDHGHFIWGQAEVVSETTFHYGGSFTIGFMKD